MWGEKSILLDGLKWRVGNGTTIKVWEDSWLPREGAHIVPTPLQGYDPEIRVSDLIDAEGRSWDVDKVTANFVEEEQKVILDIPLSNVWQCDYVYWWPASNGLYSVRSGYWLGRMGHLRTWELYFGAQESDMWRTIWSLGGPPKWKHFLWKACKRSLGVMGVLHRRHIRDSSVFPVCNHNEETIMHSMFDCKYASPIWMHSEFMSLLMEAPCDSFAERFKRIAGKVDRGQLCVFASLAWASWFCRNKGVFDSSTSPYDCGNELCEAE